MAKIIQFEPKKSTGDFYEDNKVLINNIRENIRSKLEDPNTDDLAKLEARLLLSIVDEDDMTYEKTVKILQKVRDIGIKVIK